MSPFTDILNLFEPENSEIAVRSWLANHARITRLADALCRQGSRTNEAYLPVQRSEASKYMASTLAYQMQIWRSVSGLLVTMGFCIRHLFYFSFFLQTVSIKHEGMEENVFY